MAALACAIAAMGFGLYAAYLWFQSSRVELPEYDPPTVSIDDVPASWIVDTDVRLNATADVLKISGELNAAAARWPALAALFGGLAAVLGLFERTIEPVVGRVFKRRPR